MMLGEIIVLDKIGPHLTLLETSISNEELYTILGSINTLGGVKSCINFN